MEEKDKRDEGRIKKKIKKEGYAFFWGCVALNVPEPRSYITESKEEEKREEAERRK